MRTGLPIGRRIEYKELRKINPEAARRAVLEYLKSNSVNISEAGREAGDKLSKASEIRF